MRGEIVTPGAFLCQDLGSFDHFIVQEFVFSEHVWTFIHPGLLYTPGKVYASMLNDLAISRGEEEIEKPDFQSSLIQTLPRHGFLFIQTKPYHLLMRISCSGPQSAVNLRPSNMYLGLSILHVLICAIFI